MKSLFRKNSKHFIFYCGILFCAFIVSAQAQTTAFTYQGKLTDTNQPANGTYEMQFRLFDNPLVGQGAQQGATVTIPTVQAVNGIFTTPLDFGAPVFLTGANRYLEISVRPAGSQVAFTTLAPRQQITSAPYTVRALSAAQSDNSANLGSVPANQFVQTNDARLSDARNPLAGSGNYIQNTTTTQSSANFNIDGTGTANILNAKTQFNLNGNRILTTGNAGTNNLFVGINTGEQNGGGNNNSAFGFNSGRFLTIGASNSFFGVGSGFSVGVGNNNSFFGHLSGSNVLSGSDNTFTGFSSGFNSTGSGNTFIGASSGLANLSGGSNTLLGANTNVGAPDLTNAAAIGSGAFVSASNSLVLGNNQVNVGIGTSTPKSKLQVTNGDVYLTNSANGIILTAPNNNCYRVTVSNVGALVSTLIACPN
ncbi:MAG TPA: hypothetical protein VNB22_12650 [Pyrinomonadaceae bacterium]|jgi:hypothetical protein|nr:hypothetical protein [Pyrinomonadaceae bacterium]